MLTPAEYNNTVRDLLGDASAPASSWPPPAAGSGFDNSVSDQNVDVSLVDLARGAAEKLALTASTTNLAKVVPCDPQAPTCMGTFIDAFGKRAFRRPLLSDDRQRLTAAFSLGQTGGGGFAGGVRSVIETALQSPHFLYRVEIGAAEAPGGIVAMTPYEVATRLSYFLWSTMPDGPLLLAADGGRLRTAADVRAQVERMLADGRARESLASFYRQWLSFDLFSGASKDARLFPRYNDAVNASMLQGSHEFLSHVTLASDRGDFSELFTANYAFANLDTAPLLGLPTAGRTRAFARVVLDSRQRSGLLTDLTLMATLAKPNRSAPVLRGLFVREHLLCQSVPPPPDDVNADPGPPDPRKTTREQFTEHRASPSCAACHQLLDPVGLGFENYDALGQWRTTENGKPVDASGELVATRASDGPFNGAIELAARLAAAQEASDCFVQQWFRYAFGRDEGPEDMCTLADVQARFTAGKQRIRELLIAIATTPAFLARPAVAKGGCN